MRKSKGASMHTSAMGNKKHGSPMKGGQHAISPMKKKTRPDRKGVAKSGKMSAL